MSELGEPLLVKDKAIAATIQQEFVRFNKHVHLLLTVIGMLAGAALGAALVHAPPYGWAFGLLLIWFLASTITELFMRMMSAWWEAKRKAESERFTKERAEAVEALKTKLGNNVKIVTFDLGSPTLQAQPAEDPEVDTARTWPFDGKGGFVDKLA